MTNTITILGLGNMGHALATRFVCKGYVVTGWSRSGGDARAAEHAGYRLTADLTNAVASSDVLLTSLFDDAAVEAMIPRLAALPLQGKLIAETSTIDPETLRGRAALLMAAGAGVIDAPISGGPDMIADGTIGIFMGGSDADVARFLPVAGDLSNRVARTGPLGSGYATKIMNNIALAGAFQSAIEALQTGQAMGLSKDVMLSVLEKGPAITPMLRNRLPKVRGEDTTVGFSINGAIEDAKLFIRAANAAGVELTTMRAMEESFKAARDAGFGDADVVAAIQNRLGWL